MTKTDPQSGPYGDGTGGVCVCYKRVTLVAVHTPKVWGPVCFSVPPWPALLISGLDQRFVSALLPGSRLFPSTATRVTSVFPSAPLMAPSSPRAKAKVPTGAHRALPHDLPVYPSFTLLQPLFLNIPDAFLPQGLCTGCFPGPDLQWLLGPLLPSGLSSKAASPGGLTWPAHLRFESLPYYFMFTFY